MLSFYSYVLLYNFLSFYFYSFSGKRNRNIFSAFILVLTSFCLKDLNTNDAPEYKLKMSDGTVLHFLGS